jgi:hypothetical protein
MSASNSPATLNGSGRLTKAADNGSGGKSDAEMLDDGAVEDDESEFEDMPNSAASSGGGESLAGNANNNQLTTAPAGASLAAPRSVAQLPRQRVRKLARPSKVARLCSECGTGDTPSWRRGADGARTLCNACGLQFIRRVKKEERLEVLKNWREGDPEPPRPRGRPLEHPIPPPPRKRKAPTPSPPSPLTSSSDRAATPVLDLLAAVSIGSATPQPAVAAHQLPNLTGAPWPPTTAQFLLQARSPPPIVAPTRDIPATLPSLLLSIPTRKAAKTTDATKPKSSVDFLLNSDDGEAE